MEILHKLMQLMISDIAKLHLVMMWHFPTWVRVIMGWVGFSLLFWGWRLEFGRVYSHCHNICLDMCFWRGHNLNSNGLFSQLCHLNSPTCSTLYFLCWAEQSYGFHHGVTEHTQGIGVAHFNAYFNDVLFSDRGSIKWSVIFSCNSKKAHSTFKFGFVIWNRISARGSGGEFGGHIFILVLGVAQCYLKYKFLLWEDPVGCHKYWNNYILRQYHTINARDIL